MNFRWPWSKAQTVPPDQARRIALWRARRPYDASTSAVSQRWVVADVETSGLDIRSDRLISIGAVGVTAGAICLDDSFEIFLKQDAPSSRDNILIHRIAGDAQLAGCAPSEALIAFLEFCGHDPLVGFHAPFDAAMIGAACQQQFGLRTEQRWLDLADLMPTLRHGDGSTPELRNRSLDDWLADQNIQMRHRHNAVSDALATAQLFQSVLAAAEYGQATVGGIFRSANHYRWLARAPR
jgi:DNA polymerase-3 subunit epsilon